VQWMLMALTKTSRADRVEEQKPISDTCYSMTLTIVQLGR